MTTIMLGGKEYPLARPDDLAARLMAGSGISVAEARTLLVDSGLPSMVARALAPLLPAGSFDAAEVGDLVGNGDMAAIAAAIAPFYDDVPPAPAPGPAEQLPPHDGGAAA